MSEDKPLAQVIQLKKEDPQHYDVIVAIDNFPVPPTVYHLKTPVDSPDDLWVLTSRPLTEEEIKYLFS